MINVSAAMAGEFSFSAAEIAAEIQQMGPNPLRTYRAPLREKNHEPVVHSLGAEDVDSD
jgi:hypothetical protein